VTRFPALARRYEEHPVVCPIANLAVRRRPAEKIVALTPRADDEFSYATRRVQLAIRSLGREALIVVIVAAEDDIRSSLVKVIPKCSVPNVGMVSARRKARLMPKR